LHLHSPANRVVERDRRLIGLDGVSLQSCNGRSSDEDSRRPVTSLLKRMTQP
jgi:hypothetical protein